MRAVRAGGRLWAVSPDGSLRYTLLQNFPSKWHSVRHFASPVCVLAAHEAKMAVFAACADGSIYSFDAATAQLLHTAANRQHALPLCMLAHPRDDSLYIGLQDGSLMKLHIPNLQFDCILGCGVEHKAAVTALGADDHYVFSASADGVILVWESKESNAVRELSMNSDPISSLLRIGAALWVGLSTGAVDVYDIFGDDTNGIECLSSKRPHNSPVTDLLRVGDSEVWSMATSDPLHSALHSPHLKVAVWDTRDYSYKVSDEVHSMRDLMSITVVDRVAFEKVCLLALTSELGFRIVETDARGTLPEPSNEEEGNMDDLISDLEQKLVQANEEINRLRQAGKEYPKQLSPSPSTFHLPTPSISPQSRRKSDHTNCDDTCDDLLCPVRLRKEYYDFSGEDDVEEIDPLVMNRSVSDTISSSLNKVSELLVSLLADDVLSPEENVRGNNEDLRTAVANITRELNTSKALIDKRTFPSSNVHNAEGSQRFRSNCPTPSMDKNVTRKDTMGAMSSENFISSEPQSGHATQLRMTQKKLADITRERDEFFRELDQLREETEATITALEKIIEAKSSQIKERDDLIHELRKECNTWEKRYEKERGLRVELKENLDTQLDDLSKAAQATSKSFEEQLSSAYDKIETKSVEIQAQRETYQAAERKLEVLNRANQNLESMYNQLEEQLADSMERTDEVAREFASRAALWNKGYQAELDTVNKKHVQELSTVQVMNEELKNELRACQEEYRKEIHKSYLEMQSVKDERDQRVDELNRSLADIAEMKRQHQSTVAKMETEIQELKNGFNSKRDEMEHNLRVSKQESEAEMQTSREAHQAELQKRSALVNDLRIKLSEAISNDNNTSSSAQILQNELNNMTDERDMLLKEVEHREEAQKHFEGEAENLQSAISDLKLVNDELQTLLDEKEQESADHHKKMEALVAELRTREQRLEDLEGTTTSLSNFDGTNDVSDTQQATKAILASANGEVEKLTRQIDAMNRTYTAQERELNELREALSTRDEMLRLRNSIIDDLTRRRKAAEPLSSPGFSMNVSPNEQPYTQEKGAEVFSAKSSQTRPTLSGVDAVEKNLVCHTLQEIQNGMNDTQDKLRELTNTARRYKKFAQSHLDLLPALHELEGELMRVSSTDFSKGNPLLSVQGIVQSLIAQHYTNHQKQALLKDYDENLYRPSSERLEALHKVIARLRKLRTGSEEIIFQHIDDVPDEVLVPKPDKPSKAIDETLPSTRRLLTYY